MSVCFFVKKKSFMIVDFTMTNLSLKKWKVEEMVEHPVIFVAAKRRSGKSVLIKELMYRLRDRFFCGMVQSATECSNKFYQQFVPECLIFHDFNENAINNLINNQLKEVERGTAKSVFLILDDCAFDKKTMNSKTMKRLLYNGRHSKITFICAIQYILDIEPSIRSNIDYFVTMKENIFADKLYKNFFSFVGSQKVFGTILDAATQKYGCLILDNASHASYPNNIYWYRAAYDPNLKFKLCHSIFWKVDDDKKRKLKMRTKKKSANGVRLLE